MYFIAEFLSDCLTPVFLELVFCQELEKTGFRFVRDRESDEIHLFLYRTHLILNKICCSKHTIFEGRGGGVFDGYRIDGRLVRGGGIPERIMLQ